MGDERIYYPLHARPYTPASYFPKGRNDPDFKTKLRIAADLVAQGKTAGVVCRAVVADCFYGDYDDLRVELSRAGWGFVMALKPSRGTWQYGADAYTPTDAARAVTWGGPDNPGGWTKVQRTYRDGHTETWWAAERHPRVLGTRRTHPPGRGHQGPGNLAGQEHVVSGHQPAPPRRNPRHRR